MKIWLALLCVSFLSVGIALMTMDELLSVALYAGGPSATYPYPFFKPMPIWDAWVVAWGWALASACVMAFAAYKTGREGGAKQ